MPFTVLPGMLLDAPEDAPEGVSLPAPDRGVDEEVSDDPEVGAALFSWEGWGVLWTCASTAWETRPSAISMPTNFFIAAISCANYCSGQPSPNASSMPAYQQWKVSCGDTIPYSQCPEASTPAKGKDLQASETFTSTGSLLFATAAQCRCDRAALRCRVGLASKMLSAVHQSHLGLPCKF
jgi:hypothetical protein